MPESVSEILKLITGPFLRILLFKSHFASPFFLTWVVSSFLLFGVELVGPEPNGLLFTSRAREWQVQLSQSNFVTWLFIDAGPSGRGVYGAYDLRRPEH